MSELSSEFSFVAKKAKISDIEDDVSTPTYMMECCPVKNLEDLYTVIDAPPMWRHEIRNRAFRSSSVLRNTLSDCHTKASDFSYEPRIDTKFVPKTLVCHDYKGGYLEDRYLTEVETGNLYSFYNWSHIDIFVYFSHHFITIPPLCWLNAAHKNGVKILGTIITESDQGKKICDEIFKDITTTLQFAKNLAKIIEIFRLDGWLLNIENPIDDTSLLKKFVECLTKYVHEVNEDALVIWYDSVTEEGKLHWQNELNDKNLCFFERCDGIFLNYVWNEDNLVSSLKRAKQRKMDIFVGIDVFGRNTFGGGQFNCYKAAEVIRRYSLSMAVFAPGWTHESIVHSGIDKIPLMEHFMNKDTAFWNSLWPYLYTYPISTFFETSLFIGSDTKRFDLFKQEEQLSKIVHPKYSFLISNYSEIPTLERKCPCIRLEYDKSNASCIISKRGLSDEQLVHKIFNCDIPVEGHLLLYTITRKKPVCVMGLRIVTCLKNGAYHTIYLNGKIKKSLTVNNSYTQVNPEVGETKINSHLRERYRSSLQDSDLTVYTFNVKCSHILEIGALLEEGDSICLKTFGLTQAEMYL